MFRRLPTFRRSTCQSMSLAHRHHLLLAQAWNPIKIIHDTASSRLTYNKCGRVYLLKSVRVSQLLRRSCAPQPPHVPRPSSQVWAADNQPSRFFFSAFDRTLLYGNVSATFFSLRQRFGHIFLFGNITARFFSLAVAMDRQTTRFLLLSYTDLSVFFQKTARFHD